MREIDPEKLARLPRWAQDEIKSLRMGNDDLRRQIRAFGGEPTPGGFEVSNHTETLQIPAYWHACFKVGGQRIRVSVRGEGPHDDGMPRLRVDADAGLVVKPAGGVNVVEILPWSR